MKYFVVSDIHNFYTELRRALRRAGFDKRNKEHVLIVCGDIVDRGPDALKVYKFIRSIPKSRRVLIKGNHEYLYLALLKKSYPQGHDFSNGTVDTFCQIAGHYLYVDEPDEKVTMSDYLETSDYPDYELDEDYQEKHSLWEDIRNAVSESDFTKWLQSDEWRDYYELNKFIFVHSFIPVKNWAYDPDWRNSKDWEEASWGCPFKQYKQGLFDEEIKKGKVLVCGHWHTGDFYMSLKHIFTYDHSCAPIYYSKNLIGIDGGVTYDYFKDKYNHPQNVLVIDEDFVCYDKFGDILKEEPFADEKQVA